jgi:hypothetical protein
MQKKNEINFAPVRLFPCPQPFAESAKIPDRLLDWTQSPGRMRLGGGKVIAWGGSI